MPTGNELAKVGFKYIGTPYSTMDCQAFVERCLSDLGVKKDLGGSNAWYRYVMQNGWVGSPEECKSVFGFIPPGAFLFIHAFDGGEKKRGYHDGLGNASHIGIYTATGEGAINSSATRECVCESKFKGKSINGGWNKVGLWPKCIEYWERGENVGKEAMVVLPAGRSGNTVNLREGPSTNYGIITQVPVGSTVIILDDQGTWCKIDWSGKTGYMMANYLEYSDEPDETGEVTITPEEVEQIQAALDTISRIIGRG